MRGRFLAMKMVRNKRYEVIKLVLRSKKKSPEEIVSIVKKKYPTYSINEDGVKKILKTYEW